MKNSKLLALTLVAMLLLGCETPMPVPLEGIYQVKNKTLTIFDLSSQEYQYKYNIAEVVESKPAALTLEIDPEQLSDRRFGSFRLGNNRQRTWFVMGRDADGYWSEFYIDQNNDLVIQEKEKVKSFQSGRDRVKGMQRAQSMTLIPVRIKVSYKGLNGEIQKNLYFFMITTVLSKNDASDILVEAITASFFDGEIKVLSGETVKRMNFRLIDANGNGCFNDYGVDLLFIDRNFDHYFQAKEGHRLIEFFDLPLSTGGLKQLRIIVPPYPARVGVIEADQEYDLGDFEAQSDQEDDEASDDTGLENQKPGGATDGLEL